MRILRIIIVNSVMFCAPLGAMVPAETFNFPGLPPDVQRIIQMMALKNIPRKSIRRTGKNLDHYARINKSFHAFINKPSHMKLLITLMERRSSDKTEFHLGRGFRNMPGVQNKEVQEWLESRKHYPLPWSVYF